MFVKGVNRLLWSWCVVCLIVFSGCEGDDGPDPRREPNSVGVVGCSLVWGAVKGYAGQGGDALWTEKAFESYSLGGIAGWTTDDNAQSRWNTFAGMAKKYNPTAVWWLLCAGGETEIFTYENAFKIRNHIHSIVPKATIYITVAPTRDGYSCWLENPEAHELEVAIADELIKNGLVEKGPGLHQLTIEQTQDDCHPNDAGAMIWGQDLIRFFGD